MGSVAERRARRSAASSNGGADERNAVSSGASGVTRSSSSQSPAHTTNPLVAARSRTVRSKAVLPMPGSPSSRIAVPEPAAVARTAWAS